MSVRTWRNWIAYTFLVQIGLDTLENRSAVSLKVSRTVPYKLAISVLGIYLRGMKTYVHKEACTQISTATLSIRAKKKKWKQSKCPYISECGRSLQ